MKSLYLLRHAQTDGPAALNGRTDVVVAGAVQRQLAQNLAAYDFEQLITSPLRRCSELANLIADSRPELKISVEPDFRELDFGRFDGQPFDELRPYWPQLDAFWASPAEQPLPEAESLAGCHKRVIEAWQRWLPRSQHNSLFIVHAGTIRLILAHILGVDWQNPAWYSALSIGHQSLTRIDVYPAQPHVAVVKYIGAKL